MSKFPRSDASRLDDAFRLYDFRYRAFQHAQRHLSDEHPVMKIYQQELEKAQQTYERLIEDLKN